MKPNEGKTEIHTWSTPGIPPHLCKCIWLALTNPNRPGNIVYCHLSAAKVEAPVICKVLKP